MSLTHQSKAARYLENTVKSLTKAIFLSKNILEVIINTKRHNLAQISMFFKKAKLTLLKSIYFHFKTLNKQMLVFFQTRLGKTLIWQ